MMPSRLDLLLSRRTALTGLGAAGLAFTTLVHQVMAQDAPPDLPFIPQAGHSLAGPWAVQDGPTNVATIALEANGVCCNYLQDFGMGIGAWRATGERTGEMVIVYQYFPDDLQVADLFAPGYISPGHEFAPGMYLDRITLEVDAAGSLATVAATSDVYAPDGSLQETFTFDQTWVRLVPAIAM
jgi:hypothetical protein